LLTEHIALKKDLGEELKVQWVSASVQDQIVNFINHWKQRSGLRDNWFCLAFGLEPGKTHCLAIVIWVTKPTQWGYAQRLLVMCKGEAGNYLFLLCEPWLWLSALCLCYD
jgi:hypothetical protein